MKRIILLILVAITALMSEVKAQDPHFSQFYANPLYVNPALAGTNVCPRFNLAYRNQWPGLNAFKTFTASYDQYFDFINGGIGVLVLNDRQSETFNKTFAALMYSLRLKITNDIFINLALEAAYANRSLDFSKLTFPDMIDPRYGFIRKRTVNGMSNHNYVDFSAGTVIYGENWYGGIAVDHLTQPNDGFTSHNRLPLKATVHGGMKFNISRDKRRTSAFFGAPVISPNLIYQRQAEFQNLNYGLYLDWSPFIVGAWYRQALSFTQSDAFILMLGIQYEYFKIGYSYDLTVSSLSNVSGGAHEVTLGFYLNCPEKKRKIKSIDCPSF